MADHPLRALIAWPLVLGVGLLGCCLAVVGVVGFIAFLVSLANEDIDADLGDDHQYESEVH